MANRRYRPLANLFPQNTNNVADVIGTHHTAGEAPIGFEPMHKGFADLSLTTWVRRPVDPLSYAIFPRFFQKMSVIMSTIGIRAAWWKRSTGAYSPRRQGWFICSTTLPAGVAVLESRAKTW